MRHLVLLTISLLVINAACASSKLSSAPSIITEAYTDGSVDRTVLIAELERAIAQQSGPDKSLLRLWLAEQLRLSNKNNEARVEFESILKAAKKEPHRQCAQLGLALLAAPRGLDPLTRRQLADLPAQHALPTQNADRYYWLSILAGKQKQPDQQQTFLTKSLASAQFDAEVSERIQGTLGQHNRAPEQQLSLLDQIDEAIDNGASEQAAALLNALDTSTLKPEEKRAVKYVPARIEAGPLNLRRIGVLLPLSGRFAVVGNQVKEALLYGFDPNGTTKFQLTFIDTGESEDSAKAAVEQLILKDRVVALVGPLRSDYSDIVMETANALRTPILALTKNVGVTEGHPFSFQAMVNAEQYASALAEYVVEQLGFTRFAIFAPQSPYGTTSAEAFSAAVISRGGEIVIREDYDPASTDLIPNAEKLGRKDYTSRRLEFKTLQEETEKSGGKASRVVLPPQMDFDAIFIPDTARRIPIACAALAYEEFGIGTFRPRKLEAPVPLLGLASWNHSSLLDNGGKYVQNSIFTDIYLQSDTENNEFIENYRALFSRTPSTLEVITYDTGLFLRSAFSNPPKGRQHARQLFTSTSLDASVTGTTGFDEQTRQAKFPIQILTIAEDAITPIVLPEAKLENSETSVDDSPTP